jgi:hypothetical protein
MNELTTAQSLPCFGKLSVNQCGVATRNIPMVLPGSQAKSPSPPPALALHGANKPAAPTYATADPLYLGNAEYPRGFVGGIARSEHFFSPHFEHRIRFSTSANFASQPQSLPNVCGSAVRSCPQAEHLSIKVYCPNSSLNLLIRKSRAIGANCYERRPARPSSTRPQETLYKLFATPAGWSNPAHVAHRDRHLM